MLLLHVVLFENVRSYFSHATSMYGIHVVRGFPRSGVQLGEKNRCLLRETYKCTRCIEYRVLMYLVLKHEHIEMRGFKGLIARLSRL
jgi:hypothetical protein